MAFSEFNFYKINESTIFKPFDCGDEDLNDFLLSKAIQYQRDTNYKYTKCRKSRSYLTVFFKSYSYQFVQKKHL
jgi:hypothetical protein